MEQEGQNNMENKMYMEFDSISENESFARLVIAGFVTRLDPTIEEMEEIKTAVSEAVTNCIIHGYKMGGGKICMEAIIHKNEVKVVIKDYGVGIRDIEKAKEPLYTTCEEEERSGMGFAFMEMFMDSLEVISKEGEGTTIIMKKNIKKTNKMKDTFQDFSSSDER